jgi:uncharacterized protein
MERRIATELRKASGSKLEGYAAIFNTSSADLGGFTEVIRPGAFRRTLLENKDILSLFDHDTRAVLGRTTAGTLRLNEDAKGLHFEIDMPPTTLGRDLLVSVERGDIRGASFLFKSREDRWTAGNDGMMLRELLDVDLFEITVTAVPAYPDTEVARRTLARGPSTPWRADLARRYIDLLEVPS